MKALITLAILISTPLFSLASEGEYIVAYGLHRISGEKDNKLGSNEAVLELEFQNLQVSSSDTNVLIQYSLDGQESTTKLKNRKMSLDLSPGEHSVILYIEGYEEIFGSVTIESQMRDRYFVYLMNSLYHENVTLKPVIYLYPQKETEVSVELDIDGTNPFFYPSYNNGWTVTAHKDGTIEHNGNEYNYLFWEANQEDQLSRVTDDLGFCVKGSDAISFLEDKLDEVGFTAEEKADFITFWGPKIAMNENNFVRFEWNESCDKFAELNITPNPDNIYRLYILTSPISTEFAVKPQTLPKMDRSGFTVIEWGGQYSNTKMETSL